MISSKSSSRHRNRPVRGIVSKTSFVLVALTGLLILAMGQRGSGRAGSEFQRTVGGLGLGPAVDLSVCGYLYDARIVRDCPHETGPLPGTSVLCPGHRLLFPSSPVKPANKNRDARLP
jgi:hypothetical protein